MVPVNASAAESILVDVEFVIEADGEVDMAYRITGVLLQTNRAVTRASLERARDERTIVRVEMSGLPLSIVENALRKLSQLTCVLEAQARVTNPADSTKASLLCCTNEGIGVRVLPDTLSGIGAVW